MRNEPYYRQVPMFEIAGLILRLRNWRFSCGAIDPSSPDYIYRDLPSLDIAFTADPTYDKFATLYVVPTATSGDNYYLTEHSSNPALAQTANPPTEKWTPDISVVPCLNITIKAGATALEATANEFDLPDPPDLRRDVVSGGWRVKAFLTPPVGWEVIDAVKQASAFPISLGRLNDGELWFAKKEIA